MGGAGDGASFSNISDMLAQWRRLGPSQWDLALELLFLPTRMQESSCLRPQWSETMAQNFRKAVVFSVLSILFASKPTMAGERVPVPLTLPKDRGFTQRLFGKTPSEKLSSQVRKLDPNQASRQLLEHFSDQSNLSRMSIKEFSDLLDVAPTRQTRNTIYRRYVHYWTPSMRLDGDLIPIMKLSGAGEYNLNKDFLLLRFLRENYFDKNRYARNIELTGGGKSIFMWLADKTSATPLKGRKLSTQDFLLTRYAKARGISLKKAQGLYTIGDRIDMNRWLDPQPRCGGLYCGPMDP
jgi:hypothetical protein